MRGQWRRVAKCMDSEGEAPPKQQLSEEELKALKLRLHVIEHGDMKSYRELVRTIMPMEGMIAQSSIYTHPIVQNMLQ